MYLVPVYHSSVPVRGFSPLHTFDAGVVPDMSPTASTSSHMFTLGSDSAYEQTFSMLQESFLNPDVPSSSCLNPYFASYDQELLPCAFSKRGFSGQDQRAPSHFIPTGSNTASMSVVPTPQVQQHSNTQRPGSATSYKVPKDVLHVGEDKPMAREARVARCVACAPEALSITHCQQSYNLTGLHRLALV